MTAKFEVTREGATQAAVAVAIAIERDGFAALLGAFHRRVLAEADAGGEIDRHLLAVRVGELVNAVATGLHVVGLPERDEAA